MNILFINSIGKNKFGGGEKWMIKAASGLYSRGHAVYIAGKHGSEFLRAAVATGTPTRVFNIYADFSPLNMFKITRFLKKNAIDILICNLNKDVRVAGLAARLAKTPLVLARHGVHLSGKKWKHKITLTKLTDGIITNTQTIQRIYLDYGWFPDNFIQVLYNGIEDKSSVVAYNFQAEFPGKKVVFAAGRLAEQKGFEYLIEAAAILARTRHDLVFIIAGKGRLKFQLDELIVKNGLEKTFFLWDYKENIDPYLKGCDLFVLSSLFEGMPNVVMEAMAVGKAVVATDVNGVQELMEDQKTGLVVPSRDAGALARAILTCINDTEQLMRFGANGLERVKGSFTLDRMIDNLENYLQEKLVWTRQKKTRS
jgi:glycosyltransferase involved in cell wall biosynthesis